ncbi:MAG: hypothetical protein ABJ275_12005 [Maricaulaceae bacterium]
MKKSIFGFLTALMLTACTGSGTESPVDINSRVNSKTDSDVAPSVSAALKNFQKDADIIRLKHLQYYGNLLIEYHEKTGTYPFMGAVDVPVYVYVASPQQVDDIQGGPPYAHKVARFKDLIREFEAVLGRDIKEYYDPQYEPDLKPNFYLYVVQRDVYFFAVHTSEAYAFSNSVSQGYNKTEITNAKNGPSHFIEPETLFSSAAFKRATSKTVSKPTFFEQREIEFLHATKGGE